MPWLVTTHALNTTISGTTNPANNNTLQRARRNSISYSRFMNIQPVMHNTIVFQLFQRVMASNSRPSSALLEIDNVQYRVTSKTSTLDAPT